MTLRYVLKNLNRRKIRTILMLLALIVGVGALVALNATVDVYERFYVATISNSAGDYDLVITKNQIEPNLLIDEQTVIPAIQASDPEVKQVVPRIQGVVDVDAPVRGDDEARSRGAEEQGGELSEVSNQLATVDPTGNGQQPTYHTPRTTETIHGSAQFVALNRSVDDMGDFEVISGTLDFAPGYAVVLQETADTFGLRPGDTFDISYALSVPRQKGIESAANVSSRHARTTLTVSAIALQRGVTGLNGNDGVLVDLDYTRHWLGIPGQAERIVVVFDEGIYSDNDPQAAAFRARALAENIQDILGESYSYSLPRATILSDTFEAFIFFQALVSIYGVLSLSVVGLLVRTMVMTNVREQTRDLALFRILGAPRSYLFTLVAVEVATLGLVGIGLGAVLGQVLTNTVIMSFIAEQAQVAITDVPPASAKAILLSIVTAGAMLAFSAYAPARRAAGTKIMYAINPGVAEGLGLDDLARLRERHVNVKIFWSGLVTLVYPALIFFIFPLAFSFGVLWLLAALFFSALLLLIVSTSLIFFPVTLPMERLLISLVKLVNGPIGFFAQRNIIRGQNRNTLISLMIVISATLPTFFATSLAIETANTPTDTRLSNGAPLVIRKSGAALLEDDDGPGPPREAPTAEVKDRFTRELLGEIRADSALGPNVAVTYRFDTQVRDDVGLRNVGVHVFGIDGDLNEITYPEGIEWLAGGPASFVEVQADPNAVIVSQGLSEYFERGVGDTLRLKGEGLDHERVVRIVGVLGRFSGFDGFTSKRTEAEDGRTDLFLNQTAFRELTRDLLEGPYDPTYPIVERLMAAPNLRVGIAGLPEEVGNAAIKQVATDLRKTYGLTENVNVRSTPEDIETAAASAQQIRVVILVLTTLSFVLAIFGVFVVTYISVYTRRAEIAMLKAIGDSNRHLFGMFLSEALVMTLSATLTGIVAGIILGYVFRYSNAFRSETPTIAAFDEIVTPYMLILMATAALVSTLLATWGYLRKKAIEIIRMI
ncbi:MAG: ABC transporter permease [Anaerolineae bacterium]|nr:ABC transporter permease [Anaerolineae bacterium]